jgi:hypothetical protein
LLLALDRPFQLPPQLVAVPFIASLFLKGLKSDLSPTRIASDWATNLYIFEDAPRAQTQAMRTLTVDGATTKVIRSGSLLFWQMTDGQYAKADLKTAEIVVTEETVLLGDFNVSAMQDAMWLIGRYKNQDLVRSLLPVV